MTSVVATTPEHFARARILFREYERELGVDLCFQKFDDELREIESQYGPPGGRLLLEASDGQWVGCVGVRAIDETVCELKRMYVQPAHRGGGRGRRMLDDAISAAAELGYREMRLDTLDTLAPAIHLYRTRGFVETAPYYDNPLCGARYFALTLSADAAS